MTSRCVPGYQLENTVRKQPHIYYKTILIFDVRESVHRDTIAYMTKQDALYRLIYYSKSALHVPGDVFANHQGHLTVFTVSGSVHPSCCRLVFRMGHQPAATLVNTNIICKYSQVVLMMGENITRNM
jgi:hypothetical protein